MIAIREHISLAALNTFGLDVKARYFAEIQSEEDLVALMKTDIYRNQRRLVLGGGSNVVFTGDFDGLVIHNTLPGWRVIRENEEEVMVEAASGEVWHAVVQRCIAADWGGVENLSLIPGTVGAAPIQNIGAYGAELNDVIAWVDGIDLVTGQRRRLTRDECQFGYRESVFKHALREKFFISSITLRLTKKNHRMDTRYGAIQEVLNQKKISAPTLRDISEAVMYIRRSKLPDPAVIGNAGSFFKNPTVEASLAESLRKEHPKMPVYSAENQLVKIPAGWLIEQCGWKGKRFGHVGVHEQQALVIVHYGGGTGEEILALSNEIRSSVKQKFGIALTTEVNIISSAQS